MEYYNIDRDRIFVRGFKDLKSIDDADAVIFKKLNYPSVLKEIYLINQYGVVVNRVANTIVIPTIDENGFPCIVLSSSNDGVFTRERFRIIDLVACSFINKYEDYLERGYHAINKNGILNDNYYTNIECIKIKLIG